MVFCSGCWPRTGDGHKFQRHSFRLLTFFTLQSWKIVLEKNNWLGSYWMECHAPLNDVWCSSKFNIMVAIVITIWYVVYIMDYLAHLVAVILITHGKHIHIKYFKLFYILTFFPMKVNFLFSQWYHRKRDWRGKELTSHKAVWGFPPPPQNELLAVNCPDKCPLY